MTDIDSEFYNFQTRIRGVSVLKDLEALCASQCTRQEAALGEALEYVKSLDGSKVLDLPCGYGNLLYVYQRHRLDALGIDLDNNQVALAKELGLRAEIGSVWELEAVPRYDLVSSFDFVEHVSKADALGVLRRFHAALREGGYVVLRTPCADTPFGLRDFAEDPTHKWIGTSSCLMSLLKMAGFRDISVREDWRIPRVAPKLRMVLASIMRSLVWSGFWAAGYGYPRCTSTSMILLARK